MANIASVRRFNGTTDYIGFTDGGLQAAVEPCTFAAILQPKGASTERTIMGMQSAFAWVFSLHEFNGIAIWNQAFDGNYSNNNGYASDTGLWYLVAVTKTAGTTSPRFHIFSYNAATWSHYDSGAGAMPAIAPVTNSSFYISNTSEFLNADLAAAGVWYGTALSDVNIETLRSSIAAWDVLSPTEHWLFNQASTATPVDSRMGSADQNAIVGTSVVVPSGLTFDVGSAVGQTILPDADIVTTGWATAPLFSKVNDASDATIISATAA